MKKKTDNNKIDQHNEVEVWKGKYLRALADYQNLDRRAREEKDEIRKYAAMHILERIIPVVDTLTHVQKHIKDPGFDLAYKELWAVLHEQGVEHISVQGKPFDPHQMECIEVIDGEENIAVEEVLPGYTLHGKVVRVAQVKVGKIKNNPISE